MKIYGSNAAGIKCKLKSFDDMLVRLNPQIWMLQETKLKPSERIKSKFVDDFQVFYLSRQNSQGGGLALDVNKDLEVLAVQVLVRNLLIRPILA